MNSLFLNFDDGTDTNIVFMKLKELFPSAEKIKDVTILKEFTGLDYKDDEMDIKFEFTFPHTVNMIYHGDEYIYIDDKELSIYAGGYTEREAIDEYTLFLDLLWQRYVAQDLSDRKMTQGLKENIKTIKEKVRKLW